MIKKWVIFLANRFIRSGKSNNKNTTQIFCVMGLAAGVITLVSVMSIMNGLQIGFINDTLEIESYHLRISGFQDENEVLKSLENISLVSGYARFFDVQTLIKGEHGRLDPAMVRLINEDDFKNDKSLLKYLKLNNKNLDFSGTKIIIGKELAGNFNFGTGSTITLLSLAGNSFNNLQAGTADFEVAAIFDSGYYEFDYGMVFMPDSNLQMFYSEKEKKNNKSGNVKINNERVIGVKLKNRYKDLETIALIKTAIPDVNIVSWRDYNKSFFGALRVEKITMLLLIALIFIVIGVNIFNSIKRRVAEKLEDIALLYAVGADEKSVKKIFIFEGFIIGFLGSFIGLVIGLVIVTNINEIFVLAGKVISAFVSVVYYVADAAGFDEIISFTLFPQDYFYITEIPVEVLLPETIMIFIFAFMSAVVSAYIASKKISVNNPAEYLRYE